MTKSDIAALRDLHQTVAREWNLICVGNDAAARLYAMRNAFLGLLDEVERLREENGRLTAVMKLARAEEDDGR